MAEQTIPTDYFSRRRRELMDNPGAIRSASTVNVQDFYGNLETWIVETFAEDGKVEALIQRNTTDGGTRLVVPAKVMDALDRQRGSITSASRRRGARKAVATKLATGQQVGNPEALARARKRSPKQPGDVSRRKFGKAHP